MSVLATLWHLFVPPRPKCERSISFEEEEAERKKWREAVHGNRGANQRNLASNRKSSKASAELIQASTDAKRLADDLVKKLEQSRRGHG